jgi:hypothetical protein
VRFPRDHSARHRFVFLALTGRAPDEVEARLLARLYGEQRELFASNPASATRLLEVGESAWNASLARIDLAATTMVASAVMGFDEFVVVR